MDIAGPSKVGLLDGYNKLNVRGDRIVGNSVQSQRHFSSVSNI
jgi:hypothetical protein